VLFRSRVLSLDYLANLRGVCRDQNLLVHMDGARVGNAAAKLNCPISAITEHVDSVTLCLSKGLGAPAGALVAGSDEFIYKARRARKILGGGMRQSGVVAAAGLVALERTLPNLAIDHQRAHKLATGMSRIPGVVIDASSVETNIVNFDISSSASVSADEFEAKLREKNILVDRRTYGSFRIVTHRDVSETDIDEVLDVMEAIFAKRSLSHIAVASAPHCTSESCKTANRSVVSASWDSRRLRLDWDDNISTSYLHLWLRDHCPQSINLASKQREIDTTAIPKNTQPLSVTLDRSSCVPSLTIKWDSAMTTHHGLKVDTSVFPISWLRDHSYSRGPMFPRPPPPHLWLSQSPPRLPEIEADILGNTESGLHEVMIGLRDFGLVLVKNTPPNLEDTLTLARRIGYVQRTIWGDGWDTTPKPGAEIKDTAYSNIGLHPHTDCCYLSSPCELQTFNCTQTSDDAEGGATWCVDGFSVAEHMRREHPDAFSFFCNVPLKFQCVFEGTAVLNTSPVFVTDDFGNVTRFVYNNDDRAVLDHLDEVTVEKFYEYLPILLGLLRSRDPRWTIERRLQQGEMLIVRNARVLHGRREFKGTGRTLVGCYIDRDAYESQLRVLGLIPGVGLP